jgi:hypothetical protein
MGYFGLSRPHETVARGLTVIEQYSRGIEIASSTSQIDFAPRQRFLLALKNLAFCRMDFMIVPQTPKSR